ncbi:hypothetical protein [Brevibacillus reuszeri]|nr:hypothetical protein [Brevibacillus reuszeri]MED1859855.1 hypothetical protein [Brevibacillus reuszeri]
MSTELLALISAASALTAITLGWLGRSRTILQDAAQQAGTDAMQRAD